MNVHTPPPQKILITPIRVPKTYLICHSFSLRIKLTQKTQKFNTYQIISHIQQLTHNPTEIPSTNININQQNIHDINIQRHKLNKGILIEKPLKYKAEQSIEDERIVDSNNNQSGTEDANTEIQKSENPIFSFRRTHESGVRNSKILVEFKVDLSAAVAAQKDRPVNYGLEFCDITSLAKLFFYKEDKTKIINIIQQGSCYHLDPI